MEFKLDDPAGSNEWLVTSEHDGAGDMFYHHSTRLPLDLHLFERQSNVVRETKGRFAATSPRSSEFALEPGGSLLWKGFRSTSIELVIAYRERNVSQTRSALDTFSACELIEYFQLLLERMASMDLTSLKVCWCCALLILEPRLWQTIGEWRT